MITRRVSLFFLACFLVSVIYGRNAPGANDSASIRIHINLDSNYVVSIEAKVVGQSDKLLYGGPLNADGTFTQRLLVQKAGFYNVVIYPKAKDRQLAIDFPLYMEPGAHRDLELSYNDSTYLTLTGGTLPGADKALVAYSGYHFLQLRKFFLNPPTHDQIKPALRGYLQESDSLIGVYKLAKTPVERYLKIWAMNDYIGGINRLGSFDVGKSDTNMPLGLFEGLPPVNQVYDHAEASLFYGTYGALRTYVTEMIKREERPGKKAPSIETELSFMKTHFKQKAVVDQYSDNVLRNYISGYQFSGSTDFEKDIERFEVLAAHLTDAGRREALITDFRNLRYIRKGAPMPDVVVEDLAGNKVALRSFLGHYVYIDLWASWCIPCIKEIPNLKELETAYKNKPITFLSISLDDAHASWLKKVKDLNLDGHQLWTAKSGFENLLKVQGIPHFIIYSPEGKLVAYKAPRPGTAEIRSIFDDFK